MVARGVCFPRKGGHERGGRGQNSARLRARETPRKYARQFERYGSSIDSVFALSRKSGCQIGHDDYLASFGHFATI